MKVMANDLGVCGVEQLFYAGSVKFNTDKASEGVELCKLPGSVIITRAVAKVTTAFNGGTSSKISVGTDDGEGNILGESDITATTAGTYSKQAFLEAERGAAVKAKVTITGDAATAGEAAVYIFAVGIPE